MYYTTYLTINNINHKEYFGVHSDVSLDYNYMGSGKVVQRAFKKYGKDNFTKIVNGVWASEDIAYMIESWIVDDNYVLDVNTYNQKPGGKGGSEKGRGKGVPKSDETKTKMSKAHKGKLKSKEHRAKLSESAKNRPPMTDETKKKIEVTRNKNGVVGKYIRSNETKEKNRIGSTGKKDTDETKKNKSKSAKSKPPMTDETKKKISESKKGTTMSDAQKACLREAKLGKSIHMWDTCANNNPLVLYLIPLYDMWIQLETPSAYEFKKYLQTSYSCGSVVKEFERFGQPNKDYILSLTEERMNKLQEDIKIKKDSLDKLKTKTPEDIWKEEI